MVSLVQVAPPPGFLKGPPIGSLAPTRGQELSLIHISPAEAEARRLVDAEQTALVEVIRRETAEGALAIEDVSDPHRKAGFDLKVTRADGSLRYIEVKGRRGRTAVELTENEWRQAANHPDRYWLYVVYDCETVPVLYRVPDPFARLLGRQTGAVRINAGDILAAAEGIGGKGLDS